MPRTIEGMIAAHEIAAERRAEGRPLWDRKFDVSDIFRDDEIPIEQKVKIICERLRGQIQPRFREDEDLDQIIEEMEWILEERHVERRLAQKGELPENLREEITEEFDMVWDGFYDWCDFVGRVWVNT